MMAKAAAGAQCSSGGYGCGCVGIIVTIMVLWSLWFGLPTPWGELNIDIFPPAIRLEVAVEAPDER